jgi:hypothetical protein
MPNIVIDVAAEFTGKKAFQQADTATEKLTKTAKTLGKTLGVAFSSAAILGFAKSTIKAAVEAQAQQERLTKLLKVTVGATDLQIQSLNNQAAALEKVGVVSAGNITQTQSQLATFNLQLSTIEKLTPAILDYVTAEKGAAASADQFKSMTNGLAQALSGNFASLTKTGFILDENTKSIIKNGTEAERVEEIVKVLNSTYKGFNQSLRQTSAGQLAALANAAENAKTIIGEGLVDALKLLSEDTSIEQLNAGLEKTALYIADITRGVGVFIQKLKDIPVAGKAFQIPLEGYIQAIPVLGSYINILADLGKEQRRVSGLSAFPVSPYYAKKQAEAAAKAAAAKIAADRKAALAEKKAAAAKIAADKKAAAAKIAADKKAAANKAILAKAESIFDIDKIQIEAALKGKISAEEKLRLELQRAILNEDFDLADKLQKRLEASQRATAALQGTLAAIKPVPSPFTEWIKSLEEISKTLSKILGTPINMTSSSIMNPNQPGGPGIGAATPTPLTATVVTPTIVNPLPVVVTATATPAPSTNNPFAGLGGDTGFSRPFSVPGYSYTPNAAPEITVNVTNSGSVIMQDEFVTAVSDAVTIGLGQGLKIRPPGSLPEFE